MSSFTAGAVRYASPPWYAAPVIYDCERSVLRSLAVVAFLRRFYGIEIERLCDGPTGSDRCEP